MGFRRAIVPAGASGEAPAGGGKGKGKGKRGGSARDTAGEDGMEVIEVDNVAAAVQAALMD
jgi:hypothetical protein